MASLRYHSSQAEVQLLRQSAEGSVGRERDSQRARVVDLEGAARLAGHGADRSTNRRCVGGALHMYNIASAFAVDTAAALSAAVKQLTHAEMMLEGTW
jgi:hypothetical protein